MLPYYICLDINIENIPYNVNWQIAAGMKNVANLHNFSLLTRVWPIHILLWLVNIKNERTCETSWNCSEQILNIIKTIMSSSHFSCPSWAVISDWPFDRYTRYQLVIWFLYKNCNGTFWIFIASLLFHTRYLLNLRSAFFHFSLKIASNMSINKG